MNEENKKLLEELSRLLSVSEELTLGIVLKQAIENYKKIFHT